MKTETLNMIEEFLILTPEQIKKYRDVRRAVYGSRITIPIFEDSGVAPNTTKYYFSKVISKPFIVEKIIVVFPSGTGRTFKIYPLVSDNQNSDKTGYNFLSNYSEYPFLVGDAQEVIIHINPVEFKGEKYIKLVAENGSPDYRTMDAKIEIVTFPLFKEK